MPIVEKNDQWSILNSQFQVPASFGKPYLIKLLQMKGVICSFKAIICVIRTVNLKATSVCETQTEVKLIKDKPH